MNITEAKRELGLKLRADHASVLGTGIRGTGLQENIVVLLSKKDTDAIEQIPDTYKGHRVTYEVSGEIKKM